MISELRFEILEKTFIVMIPPSLGLWWDANAEMGVQVVDDVTPLEERGATTFDVGHDSRALPVMNGTDGLFEAPGDFVALDEAFGQRRRRRAVGGRVARDARAEVGDQRVRDPGGVRPGSGKRLCGLILLFVVFVHIFVCLPCY